MKHKLLFGGIVLMLIAFAVMAIPLIGLEQGDTYEVSVNFPSAPVLDFQLQEGNQMVEFDQSNPQVIASRDTVVILTDRLVSNPRALQAICFALDEAASSDCDMVVPWKSGEVYEVSLVYVYWLQKMPVAYYLPISQETGIAVQVTAQDGEVIANDWSEMIEKATTGNKG